MTATPARLDSGAPQAGPGEARRPVRPAERHIPASLIDTPDGNREVPLESVQDLIASIEEHGQLVEVIVYPHHAAPGRWMAADGNRRVTALRYLNREVRVRVLDRAPTEAELIALRLTIDANRKAMDKADVGADVWRWLEITGATQDAAAEVFKLSPGYVSKLLAPFRRGVPELIQLLRDKKVSGTACALVAALVPDQQQKAVEKMRPIIAAHGKVKRTNAERICSEFKVKKERPRQTRFSCCGVSGVIKGNVLECLKAMAARLNEVFQRVERDPALIDLIPNLLQA